MVAYVTVFEAAAPMTRLALAAWGAGLLAGGVLVLWLLRGRDWGVAQFVAGVLAVAGALVLFSLLRPPGEARVLEGVVSGYGRGGCFTVQEESVCVGVRLPVREGQLVRVSRVGMAPVRIEVDRRTLMAEAAVEEREREARRRDEPFQRAVLLGMLPVAAGLFGWLAGCLLETVDVSLVFASARHDCAGVISRLCDAERDWRVGPIRSGIAIAPADFR